MSVKCFQHSSPPIVPRFFLCNLRRFRIRLQSRVWFGCFAHSTIQGLSRGLFHFEEEQKYTQCTLHKRNKSWRFCKTRKLPTPGSNKVLFQYRPPSMNCFSLLTPHFSTSQKFWYHKSSSQQGSIFFLSFPFNTKPCSGFLKGGSLLNYEVLNSHEIFPSVNLSHIIVDRFIALFLILLYLLHFCCIR